MSFLVRPAGVLALALAAVFPGTARSQRYELGAAAAYGFPLRGQFAFVMSVPETQGQFFQHVAGEYEGGPLPTFRAAAFPGGGPGIELQVTAGTVFREILLAFTDGASAPTGSTAGSRARSTLGSVALRVAVRRGSAERTQFQAALGPQVTLFGGDGYDGSAPWPFTLAPLARRIAWGASGAVAMHRPMSPRSALRFAVDVSAYRLPLASLPTAERMRRPLQFDVAPSIGLVFRTR